MSITGSNTASNALKSQEPTDDEPSMNEILASIKQIIAEDEAAEISLQDREQYQHPSEHSNSNSAIEPADLHEGGDVTEIAEVNTSVLDVDVEESLIAGLEAAMEEVLQVGDEVAQAEIKPKASGSRMGSTVPDSDIANILDLEANPGLIAEAEPPEEASIASDLAKISPVHGLQPQDPKTDGGDADTETELVAPEPLSADESQVGSGDEKVDLSTDGTEGRGDTEDADQAKLTSGKSSLALVETQTGSADEFADELSKAVEIIAADEALPQSLSSSLSPPPSPPQMQVGTAQNEFGNGDIEKEVSVPSLSPGVEAVPSLQQRAEKVRQEFSSIASGLSADERLAKYRVRNNPDLPSLRIHKQEQIATPADPEPVIQQEIAEQKPVLAPAPEPVAPSTFAIAAVVAKSLMDEKEAEIEQMVANIVRPTIRKWLSENLPGLVEKLVREEIETVSRGKRAS